VYDLSAATRGVCHHLVACPCPTGKEDAGWERLSGGGLRLLRRRGPLSNCGRGRCARGGGWRRRGGHFLLVAIGHFGQFFFLPFMGVSSLGRMAVVST
jgi:hypothetical protein